MEQDTATNKVLFELVHRGLIMPSATLSLLPYLKQLYAIGYDEGRSYHCVKRPVNQYTLEGVFIKSFPSIKIASNRVKTDADNIAKAASLTNKRKTAGGFKWSFVNDVNLIKNFRD